MRILVTACPAYGHVFPMLPLAEAAREAGHEVAFATGADLVPVIEERGFTAWAAGPTWAEVEGMLRDAFAARERPSPAERLRAATTSGTSSPSRVYDERDILDIKGAGPASERRCRPARRLAARPRSSSQVSP